ncbi:MAG: hypothetical protein ACJ8CR_25030 [Roseiflexaceae bacterium]
MPRFRKLSAAEASAQDQPSPGTHAQVAQEYDAYLADFAIGDYGCAELHADERRAVVRTRLHAAAKRRSLALRFRPGPSRAMLFYVVAAPAVAPAPAPAADQRRDEVARRDPTPRRSPRRRQTATERYHEVLPRWMREGQPPGRRGRSKRNGGGRT